jgi:hypothetical protein
VAEQYMRVPDGIARRYTAEGIAMVFRLMNKYKENMVKPPHLIPAKRALIGLRTLELK